MITRQVRSNASLKSIEKAQKQLREDWHNAFDNAEILYNLSDTAYLIIGSQVRWGYNNGFWSWGFGQSDIDREIAGQKEFAYKQNI